MVSAGAAILAVSRSLRSRCHDALTLTRFSRRIFFRPRWEPVHRLTKSLEQARVSPESSAPSKVAIKCHSCRGKKKPRILTGIRGCKFFKLLLSLNSQKTLGYKENSTKYRLLSRKPRSYVKRTWSMDYSPRPKVAK